MKSLKYAMLFVFMAAFSFSLKADDRKYLEGAVPVVDGKVVFSRDYSVKGVDKGVIYDRMLNWLEKKLKEGEQNGRVLFSNKEKGEIAGLGQEYLVFQSSFLSLDRSLMEYNVVVKCSDQACEINIERIKYNYEEEVYPAEEWITDEHALNKKKTRLSRGLAKFRIHTVDYMDKLFEEAALALGQSSNVTLEKAPVATVSNLSTPVTVDSPVVVPVQTQEVVQVPVTVPVVVKEVEPTATPMVALTPATKAEPATLTGFTSVDPHKIPGNIIKMLELDWMLITAGDSQQFNMMTASWGGLGRLYERPTATCFIYPTRFTYQLMERGDYYTISFYTEAYREQLQYTGSNSGKNVDKVKATGLTPITTPNGAKAFSEAWLIIECKKMVSQTLTPEALVDDKLKEEWIGKQLHKMYIGEITNVWVK